MKKISDATFGDIKTIGQMAQIKENFANCNLVYFFFLYVRIKYSTQKRKFQSSPTSDSLWYVKNTIVTSVKEKVKV